MLCDLICRPVLYKSSQIHYGYLIAYIFYNIQVMGYDQVCQAKLLLQVKQQVQYLGLY